MVKECFVFLAASLFLFSNGCEEKIKPSVLGGVSSAALPSQESWNTTVTFTDSGTVKAILKAGHIAALETTKQTLLDSGVHVDFFDEHGVHSSVLTSRTGKVDENTNDLEADGNVVVVSDSGVVVETEKLLWDNRRQLIHSDEFVTITSPKETLQGHGFESDQNLKNYKIFKVTGSAKPQ
ncbi:MAG TPA: LPS export ABC transporter periplasmic protein LptC [Bacteroidota bacterium]|nr:LPS export ABC transporter periplasmic protein LptC [Bacteroidota bacterium]